MSEALYRKYRPQIFEDVVGQEHIERTIKNAIEQDKVSHAYLFTGPRGTGKTTTARLLAKALLCEHGPTPEPDGTCDDCVMIANGEHPDVYELDAASRTGVENVREEIIGRVQFAPTRGRYKIYIIDEVHMLSTAAFNALLKTLEEPPSHVVFILATTDPQKVPETIHSRCQRFDFRRISAEAIVSRLGAICVSEDVEFEGEALDLVAHRAEGGMRNALTSLEQLIAFGEGKVTLEVAERLLGSLDTNDMAEIVRAVGTRDIATCFRWTAEYVETGADLAQFTRDLAEHIRNMYVLSLAGTDVALEVNDAMRRELAQEMEWFGPDRLARLLGVLGDLSAELKTSTNPRLSFEIALTRMVRPDSDLTLESLAERVEALESGYSAVAHVTGGGAPAAVAPVPVAAGAPAAASVTVAAPAASPAAEQAVPVATAPVATPQSAPAAEPRREVPAAAATPVAEPAPAIPVEAQPVVATTPEPAPSVAASTAAPAGGITAELAASLQNPAALQRIWQAALSTLKKNKAAYGVLFLNTKAIFDAGKGALLIEFPAENAFAFKAVQKPDVQNAVSAALSQACGATLPFSYTQGGAVAVATAVPAAAQTAATPAAGAGVSASAASASAAAAASAPEVASASAASAPAASPAPAAATPISQAPAPDPTPVDAYDIPPYDDEIVPYDDEPAPSSAPVYPDADLAPAPSPTPTRAQPAAVSSPAPQAVQPTVAADRDLPPEPDTRTSATPDPTAPAQSPEEIEAILAAGFGEGIVVEEVRE
ncbi:MULTISPECIES: DNA polymerase III subunit gamma/tau [Gordonibacter]|uniref:DNA polymerase III subunit gamma/tau n=1 Tax=Gordonibacter faecis TaxID=3047475 RepID=A0ABT7DJQ6_9ACTN|nr:MULTISPECIES: DNA polymerase III subunit gamma/tau [unclassified Gordonibacter]MDJ1649752.1 DNA polymerase III subunit gamma/tau [Gordonibacter sp. KGMB12511]HIW76555.1 DNA polymerase III subunit gamma/tau [Candidatus Gordonibacter avicola]